MGELKEYGVNKPRSRLTRYTYDTLERLQPKLCRFNSGYRSPLSATREVVLYQNVKVTTPLIMKIEMPINRHILGPRLVSILSLLLKAS